MALEQDLEQYSNKLLKLVTGQSMQEKKSRLAMYHFLVTKCVEPETWVPPLIREKVISSLLNSWYSYDVLQPLIDDPFVTDIWVIGSFTTLVKRSGYVFESTECRFSSEKKILDFIARQLDDTPYSFSQAWPISDAILPDGFRMNIIGGDSTRYTIQDEYGHITTAQATVISIRKPIYPFTLDELQELEMFDSQTRELFRVIQAVGDSFILAGGVGSAKTTVMNAMTGDIPQDIFPNISIEEIPEMTPLGKHFIRLTDRALNVENRGKIDMVTNIINSLRMTAENEYIGEVRSANIAYQFLRTALITKRQTGTTFHTHIGLKNTIEGVLARFVLEATEGAGANATQINIASILADHIRFIITLRDTKLGKKVVEIGEILGFDFAEKSILWQPVVQYDFLQHNWRSLGISEDMRYRIEVEGLETDLPIYEGECKKFRIG